MTRIPRITLAGWPHHVTQRGNRRQVVFLDDDDRARYLRLLAKCASAYEVRIWAYSLMSNHVHLICVPETACGLSNTLRDLHGDYATRFNLRHGVLGHLWQARFASTPMDEQHLANATRYVERNPVRAGMVERAEVYPWSSAAAHCGLRADPVLSGDFPLLSSIANWSEWLCVEESPDDQDRLREHTRTGRPHVSTELLKVLEGRLGRDLGPKRSPRKSRKRESSNPQPHSLELSP